MIRSRHFLHLAAAGTLLLPQLVGHAALGQTATQRTQERPGAMVAYTTEAAATVESIDQQSREVLLRGSGGRLFTVKAGPAVEKSGTGQDRRPCRGPLCRSARRQPCQAGSGRWRHGGGTGRDCAACPEGARPTGTIGNQIRATVTIDAIDRATHTVTFTGPANAARTVAVKDPEAQRFLDTLKPGDRVDLVYTKSLAVAVEPMSK